MEVIRLRVNVVVSVLALALFLVPAQGVQECAQSLTVDIIKRGREDTEAARGTEFVLAAIAEIEQTGIFASDNLLLRRIAYAETRDGTVEDPDPYRRGYDGGIWAVSKADFVATQNVDDPRLRPKIDEINRLNFLTELDLEWASMEWVELRRPLYSAIAARLVLYLATAAIPDVNDIQAQAEFWASHYHPGGSISDFIAGANELQGSVTENAANEFFLGFAKNHEVLTTLSLFVTTVEPNPVNFVVEASNYGFTYSGIAQHNSSTTVTLPSELTVLSEFERDKGIRVKAEGNKKIVVYGLSYRQYTTDAFLALPCDRIAVDNYEYYSLTHDGSGLASLLLLVACEDNTTISLPNGILNLQQQETYLLESLSMDLTGTKVVSDKPISVFPGHQCTTIPAFAGCCCDYIVEQVPPTAIWGRNFLVASFRGRLSGELIRILTSENSTIVNITCNTFSEPHQFFLSTAGQWDALLIEADSFCSIESNQPVLVMEFALSSAHDPSGIGDPFMVMITPIEQYSNNYVIDLLPEFTTNYVTLYVATEFYQPELMIVDDFDLSTASWSAVDCSNGEICGYITRVELTAGEHSLSHSGESNPKFGVTAYGFFQDDSYGYPGGLQLVPVQLATISFSEISYTVTEGDEITITITRGGDTTTDVVVLVATDSFAGTAQVGSDYVPKIQVVEFKSGDTEKCVTIKSHEDDNIENSEYLELSLSAGTGAHLSPYPRAEVVIVDNDGVINVEPGHGSQLGGTAVLVTLDHESQQSQFGISDNVTCLFDGTEVQGLVLGATSALCVSPSLARTGRIPFQITAHRAVDFTAEAVYTSVSFRQSGGVTIENDVALLEKGELVSVSWSPKDILPVLAPEEYKVDIHLLEFNDTTQTWEYLSTLESDLPNTGSAAVMVSFSDLDNEITQEEMSLVVLQVSVVSDQSHGTMHNILEHIRKYGQAAISAAYRYADRLEDNRNQRRRQKCDEWSASQPENIGQTILDRLSTIPCPRTGVEAEAPNSGLREDNRFIFRFHPGASRCFRQRIDSSQTGGSGQQCCYKEDDTLYVGPPGGGTVDRYAPDSFVNFFKHQFEDVFPYTWCCEAGPYSNCEEYYRHRPSDMRSLIPPPPPACFYGDPHIVTLDGHKYTFNGKGEFVLIETQDESFTLQGRMVQATDKDGIPVPATTFSAIVAKENASDTVQLELTENKTMIALVNGGELDFTDLPEQEFNNVVVNNLGNNTLSATFSSGAYMEAKEENGIVSVLVISLPSSFNATVTSGLMGSFNGDTSDDLLPKLGIAPLPLNATQEEIHLQFGVTWLIDSPFKSLFSYQPGNNWADYYDPSFMPHFAPVFTNSTLESQANELCEGDQFCLYDIASTGNVDLGLSTLQGSQDYEEIVTFSIPVICDPSCENGVCVANDTCSCASGYRGDRCTEQVYMPCDVNPCENGGSCTKFVLDYICECPSGYTGSFCESEESSDDSNFYLFAGVMGGIAILLITITLVCIVHCTVQVLKGRKKHLPLREEFPMKESTVYDNVATSATTDTGEQERDAHFYEPDKHGHD